MPELGQMCFGNKWQSYEMPEYAEAMFLHILEEIGRVYWNINQKQWEGYSDPGIKKIKVRRYYWGDDQKEARKPNFEFRRGLLLRVARQLKRLDIKLKK